MRKWLLNLRRDGDSNPGYPLGVYTLSRRASSTTRAPLLIRSAKIEEVFGITKFQTNFISRLQLCYLIILVAHPRVFRNIYFKTLHISLPLNTVSYSYLYRRLTINKNLLLQIILFVKNEYIITLNFYFIFSIFIRNNKYFLL